MDIPQGLHESARDFAKKLLKRHGDLEPYLEAYSSEHPDDPIEPGSLYLDVPGAVSAQRETVTLTVQSTEALLRIGDRERLFVWPLSEAELAHEEVLAALAAGLDQRH